MSRSQIASGAALPDWASKPTDRKKPRQKRPVSKLDTAYKPRVYTDNLSVLEWCRQQFHLDPALQAVNSVDTIDTPQAKSQPVIDL